MLYYPVNPTKVGADGRTMTTNDSAAAMQGQDYHVTGANLWLIKPCFRLIVHTNEYTPSVVYPAFTAKFFPIVGARQTRQKRV